MENKTALPPAIIAPNRLSKTEKIESALHDWVQHLPFQMQALLMTAMRGPDTLPKNNTAKNIIRYLRGVVIRPAGGWTGFNDNDFMWGEYTRVWDLSVLGGEYRIDREFDAHSYNFWQDHDQYPHHFIMHLIHCAEVVGYKHPDEEIRGCWLRFYLKACKSFHMNPEAKHEMEDRLNDFQ